MESFVIFINLSVSKKLDEGICLKRKEDDNKKEILD